jgi:hypothetical protein
MQGQNSSDCFSITGDASSNGLRTKLGGAGFVRSHAVMAQDRNAGAVRQIPDTQNDSSWLRKAFWIALLLTGSVTQAEAAVSDAIGVMDLDDGLSEPLLGITVAIAVNCRPQIGHPRVEVELRSSILPWELNAVVYLSPPLRHCFVLRVLLGYSRELSSAILGLQASQVDERTRLAVVRLRLIHDVFRSIEAQSLATPAGHESTRFVA